MALIDIDTWITEYNGCERLSRDIQSQIVLRNSHPRLSIEYTKISGGIRFNLKQFQTSLDQLNRTLSQSAVQGSITKQEAERRQRQIETLQSQFIHLQSQFKEVGNSNEQRTELLSNGRPSYWQGSNLADGDDDDDADEPIADLRPTNSNSNQKYTVDDLRRQQNRILEHQDEGLEALSNMISRQKHLALRIGDEFDEQNEILDSLANTMDNTNSRINNETRNVDYAIQNDSTKCYWLIIIALFVISIIVALL